MLNGPSGGRSEYSLERWAEALGNAIRLARIDQDLDQRELAAKAGTSVTALSRLEGGQGSSLQTLIRVAVALGRDDWLMSFAAGTPFEYMSDSAFEHYQAIIDLSLGHGEQPRRATKRAREEFFLSEAARTAGAPRGRRGTPKRDTTPDGSGVDA